MSVSFDIIREAILGISPLGNGDGVFRPVRKKNT
jgi:hypothetical protein